MATGAAGSRGRWRRRLGCLAVFAAVAGGSTTATAADGAQRTSGPQLMAGSTAAGARTQSTPVALPDLGLAHRRPDGGINLFRMSLSDLESDMGRPARVDMLPASSGWSYDRARVVAGDFADVTSEDDGTADHVVWHYGSDGGVRVFGIGGGGDTRPRLWAVLPHSAGWTWADSRPMAGDVNGDGWDDLVIVHRARVNAIVWVMLSNGRALTAPRRWGIAVGDFATMRNEVADADGDGNEDLLTTTPGASGSSTAFRTAVLLTRPDGTGSVGPTVPGQSFATAGGWSFAGSRQMAGDVTGDGLVDLVNVSRTGTTGITVRVSENCSPSTGHVCWHTPTVWQSLPTWSFAGSRQYVADTNGDFEDDLVTVYRAGDGGMSVWRAPSTGTTLAAPQRIATLPASSGWNFSYCRESVADTWGLM
jgi:FG-GAP-like repeat